MPHLQRGDRYLAHRTKAYDVDYHFREPSRLKALLKQARRKLKPMWKRREASFWVERVMRDKSKEGYTAAKPIESSVGVTGILIAGSGMDFISFGTAKHV